MKFFKKRKEKKDFVDLGEMHNKRKVRNEEIRQDLQNTSTTQESSGEYTDLTSQSSPTTQKTNNQETSSSSGMGFFGSFFSGGGSPTPNTSQDNEIYKDTVNPDEKKRRLSKRLKDLTEQIENLSNQIYRIEQRVEVLEKKSGSGY